MSLYGTIRGPDAPTALATPSGVAATLGRACLQVSAPDAALHVDAHAGVALYGRVFNAAALLCELGLPACAPAQLVLHAYRHWGLAFAEHLQGEFAFVLWDEHTARLLLGRDSTGVWPLCYARTPHGMAFAGQVHTLLRANAVPAALNEHHIAHWLALTSTEAHTTFFRDIAWVPPGQMLEWRDGRISTHRVFRPEDTPELRLRDPRDYGDALLDTLRAAICERVGDAPVATHLSGGLDSSTITALSAEMLAPQGRRLRAITAVPQFTPPPSERRFGDERAHATAVAALYPNIDHVFVDGSAHSFLCILDRYTDALAEPIFNPGNFGWLHDTLLFARDLGASTVLVGTSGNVTFSFDATPFILPELLRRGRVPQALRLARDLHSAGALHWSGVAHSVLRPWLPAPARAWIDRRRGLDPRTGSYSAIHPDFARRHAIAGAAMDAFQHGATRREICLRLLQRMDRGPVQAAFRQLTGAHLTDPASDPRVIAFCLSVPVEVFAAEGVPRAFIRSAMRGRLPELVRTERRRGLQAADIQLRLQRERPALHAELALLRQCPPAQEMLDLDRLARDLDWPESPAADPALASRWPTLQRGLSLGRFLRRFHDGTLFDTLPG